MERLLEAELEASPVSAARRLLAASNRLPAAFNAALAEEVALRRPFLWLPVAAGAGALLYFSADREPSFAGALGLFLALALAAFVGRRHPRVHVPLLVAACLAGGFFSACWRAARVAAPMLQKTTVADLTGFVEEVDLRRSGARFLLRVASAEGLREAPRRVRLTTRGEPSFAAGDFVGVKARLMPPARAALPGGYDFARDAYFLEIGAVGNALGRIDVAPPPEPAPASLRFFAAVDRLRNALAARVFGQLGGDAGAIAAAMVTGKRDYLSDAAKDLIRRAGIFHIITISGVQMSLVAGIFFVGLRRLLACSQRLALNYPIKKWAAALAMVGAVLYDIGTGSRVGADRALIMTFIMLAAVLVDRPSLSMRNLAFASFFVIAFEPEALLGASFQLSFAAVAALVAVFEARGATIPTRKAMLNAPRDASALETLRRRLAEALLHGPAAPLFATLCATSATASFMAHDFHELSPYVLIGNPLTLAIIEFFAVPCALLGAALYPLGLDRLIWGWLGLGIDLITRAAGMIAGAPGASVPVPAFQPWAILFLTLALLSVVLWRSWLFRASAIPFALLGLIGAWSGARFDLAIAPTGEAAALRRLSGELVVLGRKPGAFQAEQWLRADADERDLAEARRDVACDAYGCAGETRDGRRVALVVEPATLIEDCARAAILITPLFAPRGCAAPIIIDRAKLAETGAVALRFEGERVVWTTARGKDDDRPWSRPPARPRRPLSPATAPEKVEEAEAAEPFD